MQGYKFNQWIFCFSSVILFFVSLCFSFVYVADTLNFPHASQVYLNESEIFELLMLLGFSVSWYWSISKMLVSKTASGKSIAFVILICIGYCFGIASKLAVFRESGHLSPVIWLYCWNLLVTSIDAILVVYYSRNTPYGLMLSSESVKA